MQYHGKKKKIDQKNNYRFREILTWSENMLFWVDLRSLIQKCHFGEIFVYQERPKFFLYIIIKKCHLEDSRVSTHSTWRAFHYREIPDPYLFKNENSGGENCGTYSKICRIYSIATAIRNLDSKQKKKSFWRDFGGIIFNHSNYFVNFLYLYYM